MLMLTNHHDLTIQFAFLQCLADHSLFNWTICLLVFQHGLRLLVILNKSNQLFNSREKGSRTRFGTHKTSAKPIEKIDGFQRNASTSLLLDLDQGVLSL